MGTMLSLVSYLRTAAFLCAVVCFALDSGQTEPNEMSYAQRIVAIDSSIGYLYARVSLLGEPSFGELAEEGNRNVDACLKFLASPQYSEQQRLIAILSMHKLNLQDYVDFLQRMVDLLDRRLISPEELGFAVFPSSNFSNLLIEHYANSNVRRVLSQIVARTDFPPRLKPGVLHILSGEALEQNKIFRRDCCTPRN